MQRTIPQLFETSVARFGRNVMMWEKKGEQYKGTTYVECKTLARNFAGGLISLGVERGIALRWSQRDATIGLFRNWASFIPAPSMSRCPSRSTNYPISSSALRIPGAAWSLSREHSLQKSAG